jgi:hypothetical protein
MPPVIIHLRSSALEPTDIGRVELHPPDPMPLGLLLADALGTHLAACEGRGDRRWARVAVVLDGRPLDEAIDTDALPAGAPNLTVRAGSTIIVAPWVSDPFSLVLGGLAAGAALLGIALTPKIKLPKAAGSSTPVEDRYGFTRVSQDAVAGDTIPVVFGRRVRYGGKVIARVPIDREQGDGALRILILLSRGPIVSCGSMSSDTDGADASAVTGVFINEQEISTFPGVKLWFRRGAAGQTAIPGFRDTETVREVGVGGSILANTSGADRTSSSPSGEAVTYTTVASVNSVVARVRFGALYTVSGSGQIDLRKVQYRGRVRTADVGSGAGAWGAWRTVTVQRAQQSEFVSAMRFDGLTLARYDVQLERLSKAAADATAVDEMSWDSVIESVISTNTYPGMALLALEVPAGRQTASGSISVSSDVVGFAGLRIWDGVSTTSPSFSTGYSNNPADVVLSILTNTTWGLGALYPDVRIDFPSLFEWRTRCAETVSLVVGSGTRARHTTNIVLDRAEAGLDWPRAIALAARCTISSAGDRLRFIADVPRSAPSEVFTEGSIAVEDDADPSSPARITYTREHAAGGLVRANRVTVQFEDAADAGKVNSETFPRPGEEWFSGGTPEPVREETVRLDGVTNREEAAAHAIYRMKQIRQRVRTVSLVTTRPLVAVQPGERFDVATSLPGWGIASGRCNAGSTTTSVYLDRAVTLPSGTLQLTVVQADGTVETRTVSSSPGTFAVGTPVVVSSAFATAPAEFAEWALGATGVVVKPFLCRGVRVEDSERLLWRIDGEEYVSDVYSDTPSLDAPVTYTTLGTQDQAPGPMTQLRAAEKVVGSARQVELAWSQSAADAVITASVRIFRRRSGGDDWLLVPEIRFGTRGAVIEIPDDNRGYDFRAVAVSYTGRALSPADARHPTASIVVGMSLAPIGVESVTITRDSGTGSYSVAWAEVSGPYIPPVDISAPVAFRIYYGGGSAPSPLDPDYPASHAAAYPFASPLLSPLTGLRLAPGLTHHFRARAVNGAGRLGYTAYNSVSAATPPGKSIKTTKTFDLSTEGTLSNLTYAFGSLAQTSPLSPGVWTSQEIDTGSATAGELMLCWSASNLTAAGTIGDFPHAVPGVPADQWGVRTLSPPVVGMLYWPEPGPVSGVLPSQVSSAVVVEARTQDGTTWGPWTVLAPGASITGTIRRFQIRATITRNVRPYLAGLSAMSGVVVH